MKSRQANIMIWVLVGQLNMQADSEQGCVHCLTIIARGGAVRYDGPKKSSGISINLYKREDAHLFRYSMRRSSYGEYRC